MISSVYKELVENAMSTLNNFEKDILSFERRITAKENNADYIYGKELTYLINADILNDVPKIIEVIQDLENRTNVKFKP